VEQVGGGTSHLGLAEAVHSLRGELAYFRQEAKEGQEAQMRSARDSERLAELQERCDAAEVELRSLRGLRETLTRIQVENDDLRKLNGKHVNTERGLEKVVSCLQAQQRVLVEGDVAAMRVRAESAEQRLVESDRMCEALSLRLARAEAELEAQRLRNNQLQRAAEAKPKVSKKKPVAAGNKQGIVAGSRPQQR